MKDQKIKKLYYSISEVSRITSLKAYVLRYWETEFAELRPKKNRTGNRTYNLDDIKLIFLIKRLLYEDKYTIEGARQRLQQLRRVGEQMNLSFEQLRRDDLILELKKDLRELLAKLNHSTDQKTTESS
jgi:DNA-binding transcriptional MerR regulator